MDKCQNQAFVKLSKLKGKKTFNLNIQIYIVSN